MTTKERRDSIIDLRDLALELEQADSPIGTPWGESERLRAQRWDRARMLRSLASLIERNPEAA